MLLRYRTMAFTTATLLVVLVFCGIPLQVAAGRPGVVNVVGTLHGFLYIVYLVTAFQLTRRLGVPKWQMLLVLLAGTVPFCAFVAERKMTRRFDALLPASKAAGTAARHRADERSARASARRRRWLSPRALLLHVEVLVVAPGCAVAGWWQATRALAGNELSWVYSVEWPVFAGLAVFGWWHLVHEDPEAYRARRLRSRGRELDGHEQHEQHEPYGPTVETAPGEPVVAVDVEAVTLAWAAALAAAVGIELLSGVVALVLVPFGRPSGWIPLRGAAAWGVHATLGLFVGLGALAFLARVRGLGLGRIARISAWSGAVCLALAGAGGLMTEPDSAVRFLGIVVMFVATVLAGSAYLVPIVLRARRAPGGDAPPATSGATQDDRPSAATPLAG